jgi:hypothetical protein
VAQGLVKALWSSGDTLTTRIDPAVAHYTGQAKLAEAIQEGPRRQGVRRHRPPPPGSGARCSWPPRPATRRPPRGSARFVDIDDAGTGTVRLRRAVDKLDEMALDTPPPPRRPG